MDNFLSRLKKIKKKFNSRKGNVFVKKYYRTKRDKKIVFEKNIWKKNDYWDYFFQSFHESEKSKNYVPLDYYNYKVLPNLNDPFTKIYLQDKNMFDRIFGQAGVKLPETFFRCINNVYLDKNYNPINNVNEFVRNMSEDFIIKMTRISGGGMGVEKFVFKDSRFFSLSTNKEFIPEEYRKKFMGDFIVQKVIQQHDSLGKFHPDSANKK